METQRGGREVRIGEIIDCLNGREPLALVAKRLDMSPYTLSKKLRTLGYEYDSEQKKRIFIGEGIEPRHLLLEEASAIQQEKIDYQFLIYEQLQKMCELLQKQGYGVLQAGPITGEKKKQTFSVSTELLTQLDTFSKLTGVYKSRLVEEALWEFFRKYEMTLKHNEKK